VRTELRIQTTGTRYRVADVAILDAAIPTQPVATHPPLAVFEVLSPEDRLPRLMCKFGDYATMGIPEIWIINTETKSFSRYEDGKLIPRDHFSLKNMDFDVTEITKLVR
jgi:Uma2 family endonuclease